MVHTWWIELDNFKKKTYRKFWIEILFWYLWVLKLLFPVTTSKSNQQRAYKFATTNKQQLPSKFSDNASWGIHSFKIGKRNKLISYTCHQLGITTSLTSTFLQAVCDLTLEKEMWNELNIFPVSSPLLHELWFTLTMHFHNM